VETLAALYNAVNSMDLSLMPRLTNLERQILQSTDVKDMFIEKFSLMIEQRMAEDEQRHSQDSHPSSTASPRTKSKYQLPRDTHEFESRVLYNAVPVPIKVPVAITPETVGDFSLVKLISTFSTPHSTAPQAFPVHPHLTTSGPYTHPIVVLVNALLTQKRIIFLGHNQPSGSVAEAVLASCALVSGGLLRGFSRHSFPYTDLTKIDDLLKVPGFIAGVTNPAFAHKPEWWDLLCDLPTGRMKISSKIAPAPITQDGLMFLQQASPFGVSKEHALLNGDSKSNPSNDPTGDTAFMDSVVAAITNRQGEPAVRNKFRSWIQRFTQIASAFDEVVFGASRLKIGASEIDKDIFRYGVTGHGLVWPDESTRMREIAANVGRIEGWKQSRSYYNYVRDLVRQWQKGECVRGIDLGYQIDRLRSLRVGDAGSTDIYLAICKAVERAGIDPEEPDFENPIDFDEDTPDQDEIDPETELKMFRRAKARYNVINHLLSVMPEANGGLFYLSLGLFHKDPIVRMAVVGLFERIMMHEGGRHFWSGLSKFAKLAFFRAQGENSEGPA
jgi:stabilization of polarity axis protein